MAKKNKKYRNVDQFIAQTLVEFEGSDSKKKTIILVIIAVVILSFGAGVYFFVNTIDINWEIRLPWQSEDDDPLFTIKMGDKRKDKDKEEKMELVIPQFAASNSTNVNGDIGCIVKASKLDYNKKGFVFTLEIVTKLSLSFKIDKILLDDYPFDVDFELDDVKQKYVGEVQIKQTDLDRYNMIAFKRMSIYISTVDLSKNKAYSAVYTPPIVNNITYDNNIDGLMEIYDEGDNQLSYYKTETDKDNTYIYFYFRNKNKKMQKEVIVKKLLINGELFPMEDFKKEIYYSTRDIFYLTIPKRKVRNVDNFTVSFFITNVNETTYHNSVVYQTNEYNKVLKESKK